MAPGDMTLQPGGWTDSGAVPVFDGDGLVALVVGAATDAGARIARALAGRRMTVVLTDVDEEHLGLVAADWPSGAVRPWVRRLDVTDRAAWGRLVAELEAAPERLHVVVNAAELDPGQVVGEVPPEAWDLAVAINLGGVLNTLAAVLPALRGGGAGGVVVTTVPARGAASAARRATRAGAGVLMEALAAELADDSVLTVVLPSGGGAGQDPGDAVLALLDQAGAPREEATL